MKKIKNNIYCEKLYNYFNIYIIKGTNGDIMIDSGFVFSRRRINKILKKYNIKTLILTHSHIDHIWNAEYIKEKYKVKIYIGEDEKNNIDNSKMKIVPLNRSHIIRVIIFRIGFKILKPKKIEIDRYLKNNEEIKEYGIKYKIVYLKGHTKGSIGILYDNVLFAGDALVNRKKYAELSYQMQNKSESKKTIKKILDLNPEYICIGHEDPIDAKKMNESFIEK